MRIQIIALAFLIILLKPSRADSSELNYQAIEPYLAFVQTASVKRTDGKVEARTRYVYFRTVGEYESPQIVGSSVVDQRVTMNCDVGYMEIDEDTYREFGNDGKLLNRDSNNNSTLTLPNNWRSVLFLNFCGNTNFKYGISFDRLEKMIEYSKIRADNGAAASPAPPPLAVTSRGWSLEKFDRDVQFSRAYRNNISSYSIYIDLLSITKNGKKVLADTIVVINSKKIPELIFQKVEFECDRGEVSIIRQNHRTVGKGAVSIGENLGPWAIRGRPGLGEVMKVACNGADSGTGFHSVPEILSDAEANPRE